METNKLIAEFMGAKETVVFGDDPNYYDLYSVIDLNFLFADVESDDPDAKHYYVAHELRFHKSWDWLMPVVRKIVVDYEFDDDDDLSENEYRESLMDVVPFAVIEDTYNAVIEFINWYNKQKDDK